MFTGLVETIGSVTNVVDKGQGKLFTFAPETSLDNIKTGDSVCVDGVCLTIENALTSAFQVFAVSETLKRSTLNQIKIGNKVNLERAVKVGDRLGGHWVTGHVDCIGEIVSEKRIGDSLERWIRIDRRYMQYIAEKGSVTVDGISLTVAYREPWGFLAALIPHTMSSTTAQLKNTGSRVNIETDILAKYVENMSNDNAERLTFEAMKSMGY